jgi:hypothetical protein
MSKASKQLQPLSFGSYALSILLKWALGLIYRSFLKGSLFLICYAPRATKMCTDFHLVSNIISFSKFLAKLSSDSLSSDSSWP